MTAPRGLTPAEAAAWRRVIATVTPLHPRREAGPAPAPLAEAERSGPAGPAAPLRADAPPPGPARKPEADWQRHGLDSSWERRLAKAQVAPDLTIDLHGLNLEQAHRRVVGGIEQALAMGARVVLLIAGKARPHGDHDLRGARRGAIRAKLLDWLAAGPHAGRIAAVRPAHPRHGGAGAVYIVLRRSR